MVTPKKPICCLVLHYDCSFDPFSFIRKGTLTYYVIICDLNNLVPFGHKELWWPLAANRGSCDLKYVVAYGHNQLWQPLIAKFRL